MHRSISRTALCVYLIAAGLGSAQALSRVAAPQGIAPIDWETHITPGFDPPIEYQIVYPQDIYADDNREKQKKIVDSWGPTAFPVLKKLADDPAWKDFKPTIEMLLQAVKVPESVDLFVAKAKQALDTPDEQGPNGNVLQVALNQLRQVAPAEFQKLFDESLPSANASARRTLISTYARGLGDEGEAAVCAKRLREINETSTSDAEKKMIANILADYESRQRANEPMQRILDTERSKAQP